MKKFLSKNAIIILCVAIFYGVGLLGLNLNATAALFAQMIPFTLLASSLLGIVILRKSLKDLLPFFLLIFCCGYALEFAGVQSGIIFGPYNYGKHLGIKLFDIPLIIGANWFLMVLCSSSFIRFLGFKHIGISILTASAFMVLTDICLEPFAIRHDLWHWNTVGGDIPIQNFIAWFFSAMIFQFIASKRLSQLSHPVTAALAIIMLCFFLLDDICHLIL